MHDVSIYMPEIAMKMADAVDKLLKKNFRDLFQMGVEENIFRSDVPPDLFVNIYYQILKEMHNPEMLAHISFSFSDIDKMITRLLFEGVFTETARKKYKNL